MTELFASQPWRFGDRTAEAVEAEAFETPQWAAEAILDVELLTPRVLDPCCGHGTLAKVALGRGYFCDAFDLHDWGYGETGVNFLLPPTRVDRPREITVFMNPPFSLAVEFVKRALHLDVRKIVCFQRFAWWESRERDPFWRSHPPNRIHICASRANCWRFDIPPEKRKSGTPTAHAWFVWERGHPPGPVLGRILKGS
ncbi:MAG TPA: hypothetical protein VGF92_02820 [Stellaceae bacterium]|jgi:hypothetical protein